MHNEMHNDRLVIIDDVTVNKQLLLIQTTAHFSGRIITYASRMEQVEAWAIDKLELDAQGIAVGVNDDLGTGEQRMGVLVKLQDLLNGQDWIKYANAREYEAGIDDSLIHLLALIKTKRFLVCAYFIERKAPHYMVHLLDRIAGNHKESHSHVLHRRLDRLMRLNMLHTIFSEESKEKVKKVLDAMRADGEIKE